MLSKFRLFWALAVKVLQVACWITDGLSERFCKMSSHINFSWISVGHNPKRGLKNTYVSRALSAADCLGFRRNLCPPQNGPVRSFSYVAGVTPQLQKVMSRVLELWESKGPDCFLQGWHLQNLLSVPEKSEDLNTYWQMNYCSPSGKACLGKEIWRPYIGLILPLLWRWTFYRRDTWLRQMGPRCREAG